VPLVLTGVIANTDPTHGFGILGSATSRTALYSVGAVLPGDARLVAVYHDRVELERSGVREVLRLPNAQIHHPPRTAEVAAVTADPTPVAETAEAVAPASPLPKFWRVHHLTFESTDASGRVIGYELSGAGAQSGLRRGDVLTAINGLPLSDRNAAQELIEQTGKGSEPAQLTVLRNGNPVVVTVHPDF
jgi:type II secretion system protein C